MAAFTTDDTGKGVWWVIHIMARTRSPAFPEMINTIANNFFCDNCGEHFRRHLQTHPVPRDSMRWFEWTVETHNIVNRRLGKRVYSVAEANELFKPHYTEDGQCASCPRNNFNQPVPRPSLRTHQHASNYSFRRPAQYQGYQPFPPY